MSHKTMTRIVKLLGINHDQKLLDWMSNTERISGDFPVCHIPPSYIVQGDNIDKTVCVRNMTTENQNKSLHYFCSYAARDRVNCDVGEDEPSTDILSLPFTTFLPSISDCSSLRDDYIVLIARILVDSLRFLKPLKGSVPQHITHRYSKEMSKKSETVRTFHYCINNSRRF